MRFTILFFLLSLIYSCKTQKNNKNCIFKKKNQVEESNLNDELAGSIYDFTKKEITSDSITIIDAKIIGNKLHLNVSYSGGCKNHDFKIIGNSLISKSLPPIRSVRLIHYANNDECKKLILGNLIIDITELAYKKESGSEIYLQLEGVKERLLFTFE